MFNVSISGSHRFFLIFQISFGVHLILKHDIFWIRAIKQGVFWEVCLPFLSLPPCSLFFSIDNHWFILLLLLFERKKASLYEQVCISPIFYKKSSILWNADLATGWKVGNSWIPWELFLRLSTFHFNERFSLMFLTIFTTSTSKNTSILKRKRPPNPNLHHFTLFSKIAYSAIILLRIFSRDCSNKIMKWYLPLLCSLKARFMYWLSFNYGLCLLGNKTIKTE